MGLDGLEGQWSTYIQTTSSNISTDQSSLASIAKFEESIRTLLLLLFAVKLQNGQINIVQKLGVVFHAVAAGEENNDLLLQVALEERKEQQEALVSLTDDVALFQTRYSTVLLAVINVDIQWAGAQRYPGQILNLGCLSCGEQHGLTLLGGKDLDDLTHLVFETDFENTVSLIDDKGLQVLEDETLCVLEVIKQTTRGGNEQVHTLHELLCLGATVSASDDNTVGLRMVGHKLPSNTEDLQGQFASGRDNENTGT